MQAVYITFCKMMRTVLLRAFLSCVFLIHSGMADKGVVGPGLWSTINVEKCPEDASMPLKIEIKRHKVNRTHDGFDVKITFDKNFDETYSIRVEVFQCVDGGCKAYQVLSDNIAIEFIKKYSEANAIRAMEMANIEPAKFPIKKGTYQVIKFVFDYEDLPVDCPFGTYEAVIFLLKEGLEQSCLKVIVKCDPKEDEAEKE